MTVVVPPISSGVARPTRKRESTGTDSAPPVRHFVELSKTIKQDGMLGRTYKFYAFLSVALFAALAGAGVGFVLLGDSWFQLLIAAALGVIFTQVAFLAHEASHRAVLVSGPANDRIGRFLASGVVGISYAWWMTKHSRHHANPNKIGKDPDVDKDTISFLEEDAEKATGLLAWVTRRQGYLFFPLLLLEGFNLHVRSIMVLFRRGKVDGRWIELSLLATRFILYFGVIFWFLPLGMAFAFIGVQMAVFGLYMGASFAPNHKGMPIVPRDAKLDFMSKQVLTSRNVTGGWWATVLLGGLNYQVEHHLFPNMSRPHLAATAAVVKEYCKTHGIKYTEATLMESYGIVIQYLNKVGLSARDPFDCPTRTALRRS